MKTWVRKSLKVGVLSAGIILVAGGAAQASDLHTSDNDGALTGNQLLADVDIPINLCGNAIAVLDDAEAACSVGGGSGESGSADLHTMDNGGAATGNQVHAPIEIPINICGNAIGVLGDAAAACEIGEGGTGAGGYESARTEAETGDNDGALTGNQALIDVNVPINACGNAISVAGDSAAACSITGMGGSTEGGLGDWSTSDNEGLLTGNQLGALIDVPVNVCGNAVGVLGDAAAACSIGDGAGDDDGSDDGSDDGADDGSDDGSDDGDDDGSDDGTGGGAGDGDYGDEARRGAPEDLPVFSSIKGLTQLTDALPVGNLTRGAQTESASGFQTGDNDGVATGNQVFLDLDAPITITDNVVNVL